MLKNGYRICRSRVRSTRCENTEFDELHNSFHALTTALDLGPWYHNPPHKYSLRVHSLGDN